MFFPFDTQKTIQAIGVLLRCHRFSIASKLRILKLLYIADRESIKEAGRPMLGARAVAMDHGPLHSAALNLINGEHIDEPEFAQHFDKFGYMVQLCADPGVDRLSRYEIEKLQEVCERHGADNDWKLSHVITHSFQEWIANFQPGTSTTIPLESIIDAVGRSEDKQSIMQELESEIRADQWFEGRSL